MIGLMTTVPCSAARVSMAADHDAHSSWSESTSIRTLLSTRVGTSIAPCHRHDLLRRESAIAGPTEAIDDHLAARFLLPRSSLADADAVTHDLKFDLAVWQQSELLADVLRDRDLPFARDTHSYSYW